MSKLRDILEEYYLNVSLPPEEVLDQAEAAIKQLIDKDVIGYPEFSVDPDLSDEALEVLAVQDRLKIKQSERLEEL